ncbi:MAG: hypothetical protein Q4F67_17300 [Propionibacteriaceae bacterium]|nr:hypothetical protein [Propionibacteriaceae bacterium]
MGFMRSFIAFTLLVVAVVLGFGGMGAHWLDRLARTPAPMQQIVGPLASDEEVLTELNATLTAEALAAVPAEIRDLPGVGEQISGVLGLAVDAAAADPGMQRAFNESINRSRVSYVAALDNVRGDQSLEAPTIWFDLTPVAELGQSKLRDVSDATLHPYLDLLQPGEIALPLGQPSASITGTIADGIGTARHWPWMYVGAALLTIGALFAGSRHGRWVALTLAGVFAAVGLWFGRSVIDTVGFPRGDTLAATIRTQIVDGGKQHFLDFTHPAMYVAYGAIALGILGLIIAAVTRRS